MKITPYNHGSYLVTSETGKGEYLVDLTERVIDGRAHGKCSCTYYETTAAPNLRKSGTRQRYMTTYTGKVVPGVTECKHIAAAREYYLENVTMKQLAKGTR